ncbi:hypothetical protein LOZ61_003181 [Ophidiomyces ophidiicola]|nr:hypothetical protein LOZ61_003181 [Ophidiomyces ophidiicola]KAI1928236.1 hypothetical protein LOZ60_002550 [Ophidiomyces ophidiicola]KAI1973145.1 hypothetical protein LOZ56_001974 [Ophidiomyces ophidiicola]KAI2027275.1 hypothetical protein LOZ48_004829 [Ophidiomyces ophidiicola]KAI2027318.1 hypothetical protein LOZ45_002680 [Ophidiomyces ophidiicola]
MPLFSHYGDVDDISNRLAVPALVFSIVTPLFVIARFWSRRTFAKSIDPDDWVILASWVFAEAVCIQMMIICQWAFGKHKVDVKPEVLAKSLKLYFFAQILYKINIGLTKISILLLYIKVFVQPWFRRTCWVCVCVIVAFTTGTVVSSIFQCVPVQYAFDKKLPGGGTCLNLTAFWYANAVFNILSDVVIIILPTPIINKLHSPTRTKIAVSSVFAVGIFVCITSILRFTTLNIATSHLDIPWTNIGSSMWTIIESNLGIICACMPTLWRPISRFCPWLASRVTRSKYGTGHSAGSQSQATARRRPISLGVKDHAGCWTKITSSEEQLARDYETYVSASADGEPHWPERADIGITGNRNPIRKDARTSVHCSEGDSQRTITENGQADIEMKRIG